MSFLAIKLLKVGYSQAKKHQAKKQQQQQDQHPSQQPKYPAHFPEPYPMSGYPPASAPGVNVQCPPPAQPHLPPYPYPYPYQYQHPPGPVPTPTSAQAQTVETPTPSPNPAKKPRNIPSMLITTLRLIQFITGLVIIGLYGRDIHHDRVASHTLNPKWGFAILTGFLASSTAGLYMVIPFCLRRVKSTFSPNLGLMLARFLWEFGLVVAWLTLFGIFAKMYLGVSPTAGGSPKRDLNSTSNGGFGGGGTGNGTAAANVTGTASAGLGDASKINRMQHAVWMDLANLGLWVVTASWILIRWLKGRRAAKSGDCEKADGV